MWDKCFEKGRAAYNKSMKGDRELIQGETMVTWPSQWGRKREDSRNICEVDEAGLCKRWDEGVERTHG